MVKTARFGREAGLVPFGTAGGILHGGVCYGHIHLGIILRHGQSLFAGKSGCQPTHLRMSALTVCVKAELPDDIAGIQARDTRNEIAIASSVKTVAGVTCGLRSGITARQGDQFSAVIEAVFDRGNIARSKQQGCEKRRPCRRTVIKGSWRHELRERSGCLSGSRLDGENGFIGSRQGRSCHGDGYGRDRRHFSMQGSGRDTVRTQRRCDIARSCCNREGRLRFLPRDPRCGLAQGAARSVAERFRRRWPDRRPTAEPARRARLFHSKCSCNKAGFAHAAHAGERGGGAGHRIVFIWTGQ